MRKMGLDVGDRTVGIAVSDGLNMTAQGKATLERTGIRKDTGRILELIKENDCDTVVVGLPLSMDGTDSEQTVKTREFARMLENKLRSGGMPGVKVVLRDERLTSVMAERAMIEGTLRREKRKKIIDRQAAVIILQSYLDSINQT